MLPCTRSPPDLRLTGGRCLVTLTGKVQCRQAANGCSSGFSRQFKQTRSSGSPLARVTLSSSRPFLSSGAFYSLLLSLRFVSFLWSFRLPTVEVCRWSQWLQW